MNILYLSCHSILEEAELSIFHELGHNVFSLGGAYQNPEKPGDPKRNPLPIPFNQRLNDIALQCSKDNIHDELLDWADVIICMHRLDWLKSNWVRIRERGIKTVWRSIGQSIQEWEVMAKHMKPEGLKIVRYSPYEDRIPRYAGTDDVIRFGVDPREYIGWTGGNNKVHLYGQAFKSRGKFLNYEVADEITKGYPRVMYGPGNEDTDWSDGVLSFEELKESYKRADVAIYTGTVPASYTLTFIEMMMMGVPIVALGEDLHGCHKIFENQHSYEIPDIIKNGYNGFVSDSVKELREYVKMLLNRSTLRAQISDNARKTAIALFDRSKTMKGWDNFLKNL